METLQDFLRAENVENHVPYTIVKDSKQNSQLKVTSRNFKISQLNGHTFHLVLSQCNYLQLQYNSQNTNMWYYGQYFICYRLLLPCIKHKHSYSTIVKDYAKYYCPQRRQNFSVHNAKRVLQELFRDDKAQPIQAITFSLGHSDIYLAEAMALHQGLKAAIQNNFKKIIIEGDNLLVINSVLGSWNPPWKLDYLITDIRKLLNEFEDWISMYFEKLIGQQTRS